MIRRIKFGMFALMVLGLLATSTASGAGRDIGVDLLKIATRFVENYSTVQHKAGDANGMFIEDVVIPGVVRVIESYKGKIPAAARNELYRFLIASKSMASEELSAIAAEVYLASPKQFCRDISKLSKINSRLLIRQASDGVALSGLESGKVKCS